MPCRRLSGYVLVVFRSDGPVSIENTQGCSVVSVPPFGGKQWGSTVGTYRNGCGSTRISLQWGTEIRQHKRQARLFGGGLDCPRISRLLEVYLDFVLGYVKERDGIAAADDVRLEVLEGIVVLPFA